MGGKMVKQTLENAAEAIKNAGKNIPHLDREAMMKAHRKNMEALTEANKTAIEVMKSIAQLQSQYVKQTFEDFTAIMKDAIANPPMSKEVIEKNSARIKEQFTKAWEHGSSITNTLAKSHKEIFEIMQNRAKEGAHESLDMIKKAKQTKH